MNSEANLSTADELSPQSNTNSTDQNSKKASIKYSYNLNKDKKPKRNKSAFILFSIQARNKLKSESHNSLNSNEIMVQLADQWKNLPDHERQYFELEASKDRKRYHLELENFWKNNPAEILQNRTKKNHVKKPCSAYGFFLKDIKDDIKKEQPDLKMADVLKVVAERWRNLEEDKKSFYQEKAKQDEEQCREKLGECIVQNEAKPQVLYQKKKARHQNLIRKQAKIQNPVTMATSAMITNQNTPRLLPPNPFGALFLMNLPRMNPSFNMPFNPSIKEEFSPECQPYVKIEQKYENQHFAQQYTTYNKINQPYYENQTPLMTAPLNMPRLPMKEVADKTLLLRMMNQSSMAKTDMITQLLNQRRMAGSTAPINGCSFRPNTSSFATPNFEFGNGSFNSFMPRYSRPEMLNTLEMPSGFVDVKKEPTN